MSYSDYLDQEKDSFNGYLPYEFYKVLVARRIENNILQENMKDLEKHMISRDSIISENESIVKQLNNNYESMKNAYTSELEVSKRMKPLLKEKKKLKQAQSNHNQKLEDKYNCSKVTPNTIKTLQCIEDFKNSFLFNIIVENALLTIMLFFRAINELQNENGSKIKDMIFAVKSKNNQLLEKLKQLQKTTMNNHIEI
ncbi:14930_t:CDS:2 [Gigaspora margarita]|uniref:14930_t:CDS:1 n=1 Tax=Gigaspora margarita TaxID=4874 RepID=A0ABN7WB28_GIGMA|nr:14930_t:CDS:2 [Gigaspora margarita]